MNPMQNIMKKKINAVLIFLLMAIILSQCSDSKYSDFKNQLRSKINIKYGTTCFELIKNDLKSTDNSHSSIDYGCNALPFLLIHVDYSLKDDSIHTIILNEISISSKEKLKEDLTIYFPVEYSKTSAEIWIPLKNGIGKTAKQSPLIVSAGYRFAGKIEKAEINNNRSIFLQLV
jgi:hypothetical protein